MFYDLNISSISSCDKYIKFHFLLNLGIGSFIILNLLFIKLRGYLKIILFMNILVKFIKLNDLMICFFYNLTHIYDEIIDIDSFLELIKLGLKISFNYS